MLNRLLKAGLGGDWEGSGGRWANVGFVSFGRLVLLVSIFGVGVVDVGFREEGAEGRGAGVSFREGWRW